MSIYWFSEKAQIRRRGRRSISNSFPFVADRKAVEPTADRQSGMTRYTVADEARRSQQLQASTPPYRLELTPGKEQGQILSR